MVRRPLVLWQDKRILRKFWSALSFSDTSFGTYYGSFFQFQCLVGMIEYKVDALPFVGIRCPGDFLGCQCRVVRGVSISRMRYRVGIEGSVGIPETVLLQGTGCWSGNDDSMMVGTVFGGFGPVQMRRFVEVPSQKDQTALGYFLLCVGRKVPYCFIT